MKNVLSVNGGGGTGGVGSVMESMSCLGVCMWMCVKERPWKVQLGVCVRCGSSSYAQIHFYRIQRRGVEISFVQQIAGGDTLLEFQTATTSSCCRPKMLR